MAIDTCDALSIDTLASRRSMVVQNSLDLGSFSPFFSMNSTSTIVSIDVSATVSIDVTVPLLPFRRHCSSFFLPAINIKRKSVII